jgi:hypothetical protein
MKIIEIVESPRKGKRYRAIFDDGKKIDFGLKDPKDGTYLDHHDKQKRFAYWARHIKGKGERSLIDNLTRSPSLLSMALLWGKSTDLQKNIKYLNDLWEKDIPVRQSMHY